MRSRPWATWFLPSLRENVRVRTNTVVNLTLNTLYEAMQWLPAEPRTGNAQQDDWAWTLRSAANRPLLRWLEDGPLVVVSDVAGAHPRLKARLMATGQEGTFGESGERISAAVEETPSDSRELLARVDFAPDTDAGMESMLGFRQDLGFAGSVQSVAAVALHPEMAAGGAEGLDEAAVRSWETIHLGDEFEAEVGSNQVLARFSSSAPDTVASILPFASAGWRDGNSAIRYRMTTFLPGGAKFRGHRSPCLAACDLCPRRQPGHRTRAAPGTRLGAANQSLGCLRAGFRRQNRQSGPRGHGPLRGWRYDFVRSASGSHQRSAPRCRPTVLHRRSGGCL